MYYINLKNGLDKRIKFKNQKEAAEKNRIAQETLSRILNGRVGTSKPYAYCITKIL